MVDSFVESFEKDLLNRYDVCNYALIGNSIDEGKAKFSPNLNKETASLRLDRRIRSFEYIIEYGHVINQGQNRYAWLA